MGQHIAVSGDQNHSESLVRFSNQTVLVTGAASGIGFELLKSFLKNGATVVGWDYSERGIEAAQEILQKEFSSSQLQRVSFGKVNVADSQMVQHALKEVGTISVLINNAGITRDKSFAKMTEEEWNAVIQTNLSSLFFVSKSALDKFSQPLKRIINISSVVGLYGNFGQANYAAAKAGVIGFTKTLAKELGRKGFTVNAIAPGFIRTPMTELMPPEVLQSMAQKVPVQRLGEVGDIARAALFLADPANSYLNGLTLSVDGGLTL